MKLQKRLLERANQPHSYIMADVERAERELAVANKKVKVLEEELKKSRKEVETLQIVSSYVPQIMYSKNVGWLRIFRS